MTWSVWRVAPVVTSIFFILGVFTLYVVLVDWLKSKIRLKYPKVREHTIESWFGVIYILIFVYSLQLGIAGQDISWLFMNFQLIAVIFCAYFLAIHIPFKAFLPIVVLFMWINSSLSYWESWTYSLAIILFYWSMNYVYKWSQKHNYVFLVYFTTGTFFGMILWFLVKIKFSLSWYIFIQEISYFLVFQALLYSYIRMLNKNQRLENNLARSAHHDALTQAKNYAAYMTEVSDLFQNSHNNKLHLSMMMFDIDHFKHINDTYGHLAGDKVLQHVVDVVQTVIDENDSRIQLYRTGGEEFNVLFPSYDLEETQKVVPQIFNALNHLGIDFNGQHIDFTVSIGVSEVSQKDDDPNDFYKRVDANLYHSKDNGRMQITAK